jgi:uncharacterized membrane protein YhaH (DUF805 family)/uncharacterized protein YndB with AHSA1/START domain
MHAESNRILADFCGMRYGRRKAIFMTFRISSLWRWDGTVGRGLYALVGVLAFALKHNLDRFLATLVFHRSWSVFNYWIPPVRVLHLASLPRSDALFLLTMLMLALPFIWVGVALTVRRLRAIGLPLWLVVWFFVPVLNLLFFLLLSTLPSRALAGPAMPRVREGAPRMLDRFIPNHIAGSAAMAVLVTAIMGIATVGFATTRMPVYGVGLYVSLPFCLGLISSLIDGYHHPRSYLRSVAVSALSVALVGLGLFALAIEGVFCLLMAAPIGLALALMGGTVGYFIERFAGDARQAPATLAIAVLFSPGVVQTERVVKPEAPLYGVTTSVEIHAPAETVWRELVAFNTIDERPEWLFRAGIASPTRATIAGRGPGAVRHCVFSTGAFVEPIETWDEPRRLAFSVASNPPSMTEWTPYGNIQPPHLEGFLVSERGEFRLTPLGPDRTLLEGTTWYRHHMRPAGYWRLWSDFIIHKIHARVLEHIQHMAKREDAARGSR